MEYVFAIAVIVMLIDLEDKVSRISKYIKREDEPSKKNIKKETIYKSDEFIGKEVYITLNDECEININSEFLYNQVKGEIVQFDSEWIAFKFYNKAKKKNICQFIRVIDIESIDIVSND